tara:strand:- start:2652 stop:2840 length:189 start_codon:yes stop_codon:yes gene_type:complete
MTNIFKGQMSEREMARIQNLMQGTTGAQMSEAEYQRMVNAIKRKRLTGAQLTQKEKALLDSM